MNVARRLWIAPLVLLATSVLAQQPALTTAPRKVTLHIEPQAVGDALSEFGRQTGLTVMIQSVVARGVTSPKLDGSFTLTDALDKLLSHTGLHYEYLDAKTVAVLGPRDEGKSIAKKTSVDQAELVHDSGPTSDGPAAPIRFASAEDTSDADSQTSDGQAKSRGGKIDEIVITGTHIRGEAAVGSQLTVYSRQDIDQSGAATLDQFARQMVENFSSVDTIATPGSSASTGRFTADTANNVFGGSAFDLHGVGASSTLVLLNGHRLAPAGATGSFADVSAISLSAIDHIDVLADGASAIYGADAVAGVVNIVTRKDFDGADTGVRYGVATDGGARDTTASQLLGNSWRSGNLMLNYEYDDQGGLDASSRDYILSQGGPQSLIPENRRNSVLVSGRQEIGAGTVLSGDLIYSDRKFLSRSTVDTPVLGYVSAATASGEAKQSGATATIDQAIFGDWRAGLTGNYSRVQQSHYDSTDQIIIDSNSNTLSVDSNNAGSDELGFDALASGSLISLPGGALKAALGGSFRRERFEETQTFNGIADFAIPRLQRHVTSGYVELVTPLVGPSNNIPLVSHLEISVAGRYDSYSDFGSTTNPKVGISWELRSGLEVHASFGKSFRAPLLSQLGSPEGSAAEFLPDSTSPIQATDALFIYGGNSRLRAEKSKSYTAGFDLKIPEIPGFSLTSNYFHLVFTDRIATPPSSAVDLLGDPALASFVQRNPPLAEVLGYFNSAGFVGDFTSDVNGNPLGANGVAAVFDNRYTNISSTKQAGIDTRASYVTPTEYGQLVPSLSATWLFKNTFQVDPSEPVIDLLNTFAEPTRLKLRGNIGWNRGSLSANVGINYINSYQDTLSTPPTRIGSWATGDLYVSYRTAETTSYGLGGLTAALSILNLTNEKPPYANVISLPGTNPLPFDAANASPVGRLISIQLNKRW